LDWRFDGLTALVSIAAGKAADLVVLAGNRAKNIDGSYASYVYLLKHTSSPETFV
jgi:imidazolonepropionase-like amidohydrolase